MRYLEKFYQTYHFTIAVPKDLQAAVGKSRIRQSLKTSDPVKAQALALAHAERAKQMFADLRAGKLEEERALKEARTGGAISLAEYAWEKFSEVEDEWFDAVVEFERGPSGEAVPTKFKKVKLNKEARLANFAAAEGIPSQTVMEVIEKLRLEPFISKWIGRLDAKPKTKFEMKKAAREFVAKFKHIEAVTRADVLEFYSDNGKAEATNRKELGWATQFLHFVCEQNNRPRLDLDGIKLFAQRKAVVRQALTLDHLHQLYDEAGEFAVVVKVLYLSGMRLGEVMNDTTKVEADGFHIESAKTGAGVRWVPRHDAITDEELEELRALRAATRPNKYGQKTKRASQELNRKINALGLGPEYVVHSIRKLTVTMLQNLDVPEVVAANLVGHRIATQTYGLYSQGAWAEKLKEAINKLPWDHSHFVNFQGAEVSSKS